MFERFTATARLAVVEAREQALTRGSGRVHDTHVLVALFAVPDNLATTTLNALGVRREAVEDAVASRPPGAPLSDAEALATLGIDLGEVRRQVEDAFGPGALERTRRGSRLRRRGHLPFDRSAKKVLESALYEALRMRHNYIGTEHILLGLLHSGGPAGAVLTGLGIRLDATRVIVDELVRRRRAG